MYLDDRTARRDLIAGLPNGQRADHTLIAIRPILADIAALGDDTSRTWAKTALDHIEVLAEARVAALCGLENSDHQLLAQAAASRQALTGEVAR